MIDRPSLPIRSLTSSLDGYWSTAPPDRVSNVCIDSREAVDGSLFVALEGDSTHGHQFLEDACENGTVAAIVESPQPVSLPQYVVKSSRDTLSKLAREYQSNFASAYRIGVTGSCGKTTVKNMISQLLDEKYRTGRTQGNFNNYLGLPLTMLNQGHGEILVAEVATNAPGEIKSLSEILNPHMGIITHVGAAHLEGLGTVRNVAEEKADIFRSLDREGIALLPGGLEHEDIIYKKSTVSPIVVKEGMRHPFEINWSEDNSRSFLHFEGEEMELKFTGEGLVIDAALAATVAALLGVKVDLIREILENFRPLKGRGQIVNIEGCQVIDGTYNANPVSMRNAIDRLDKLPCPRLAIIGDMKELGDTAQDAHRKIGSYLNRLDETDLVFVGEHAASLREGLDESEFDPELVQTVENIPDPSFSAYNSALLKASNSVGLESLIKKRRDVA